MAYRQRQAQATRQLIVASARKLFGERGYAATTMLEIAKEAGVAVQTVYAIFGTKKEILGAIRQAWLAEVDLPRLVAQALAEPDLDRRLDLAARWTRLQYDQGIDVIVILDGAATADPGAARERRRGREAYRQLMDRFVSTLSSRISPSLDPAAACDIFAALTLVGPYQELVIERGWAPDRYQQWLAQSLRHQLFGTA